MENGSAVAVAPHGNRNTAWALALREQTQAAIDLLVEESVRTSNGGFIGGSLPLFIENGSARSLFGDEYEIEVPS